MLILYVFFIDKYKHFLLILQYLLVYFIFIFGYYKIINYLCYSLNHLTMNTLHKILKFLFCWFIAFGVVMLIHSIVYFNPNDIHQSVCEIVLFLFVITVSIINLIAIQTK